MGKTVKFAVSMPLADFEELETLRRETGQSRSQCVLDAVRHWKSRAERCRAIREESSAEAGPASLDLVGDVERRRRAIEAAGRFRSGITDLPEQHDHYLEEALAESGAGVEKEQEPADEHLRGHQRIDRRP